MFLDTPSSSFEVFWEAFFLATTYIIEVSSSAFLQHLPVSFSKNNYSYHYQLHESKKCVKIYINSREAQNGLKTFTMNSNCN